ncbi:MAG: hypothetical protein IPJ00_06270 [Saprospirales bacterium]|nr:hypothetical protein [Saprospirales bacterium]
MPRIALLLALALSLVQCTTKETIYQIDHENVVIPDNEPPPYSGVTTLQIRTYVNKIYIDLLGREPLELELDAATTILRDGELKEEVRESVVRNILEEDEYYQRFWEIYSGSVLNGITRQEIADELATLEFVYDLAIQNGDLALAQFLVPEIAKMDDLYNALPDYQSGAIDTRVFLSRMAYNSIYDQINMGSFNFVLACFENFFKRAPTATEEAAGISMVDGFPAQLLFKDGNSKNDFLDIFTQAPEFNQGLVFDIYGQLLARKPTSPEMGLATIDLHTGKDYQDIQVQVAITDEYAGF